MSKLTSMTDLEIVEWLTNFINVASPNPAKYGMTAATLADLTTLHDNLQDAISARQAADEAAAAAVAVQSGARDGADPMVSFLMASIKKNPALTDAERIAAGVEPNKPPTHTPPAVPTELTAEGFSAGYNRLKWKRGGNKQRTIYIVECRMGDAADFSYLASSTELSYDHQGVTPGVQCVYRVKAQRAGEESLYSNPAVVYMN